MYSASQANEVSALLAVDALVVDEDKHKTSDLIIYTLQQLEPYKPRQQKYDDDEEGREIGFNEPLEPEVCHISSARVVLAAIPKWASSGHLRSCSDVDTTQMSLSRAKRCFYTIMANYDGSLEAVDCHIHCVTYDLTFNRGAGGRAGCLIRSPTTL